MLLFPVAWALFSGFYLLFAGQVSADEGAAAALCGLAAALWSAALWRVGSVKLVFGGGEAAEGLRAAAALPEAAARVAGGLARALALGGGGEVRKEPFAPGRLEDPHAAGRRAAVILARSMTPDRFVLRIPQDEQALEQHVFARGPAR